MTHKTEQIKVMVDEKTKKKIKEQAEKIGLDMSSYSRMKLKQNLNEAQA